MATERFIENNVIRNRDQLGYAEAAYIRRCRAGRGFGVVDVLLLPTRGPHRVVLVEAKQAAAADATAKVIGQLLLYYAGILHLGARGIRLMRDFATAQPKQARGTSPKQLRTLSGGISPPEAAWAEMRKGRRILAEQVGLFIALDAEPAPGLRTALSVMAARHGLSIGVVSVTARDRLQIWCPGQQS